MRLLSLFFQPLQHYWRSLTDVAAYPQLSRLPRQTKLVTLLVVYLLLAVVSTLHFVLVTRPRLLTNWQETWTNLQRDWPSDLSFNYQNHRLTVTPNQSLNVPYPSFLAKRSDLPSYLAIFDTTDQPTNPHHSLLFITGETITISGVTGDEQTTNLTDWLDDQSWHLDRSSLADHDADWNSFLAEAARILTFVWFSWRWIGLLILRLIGLILYAWIAKSLLSIFGMRLSYQRSYGLGLIVLWPAETVQTLINVFYTNPLPVFWWAWLAMILLVGWLNRGRR